MVKTNIICEYHRIELVEKSGYHMYPDAQSSYYLQNETVVNHEKWEQPISFVGHRESGKC